MSLLTNKTSLFPPSDKQRPVKKRSLRVETLEERRMLAVVPLSDGITFDQAEFDQVAAEYGSQLTLGEYSQYHGTAANNDLYVIKASDIEKFGTDESPVGNSLSLEAWLESFVASSQDEMVIIQLDGEDYSYDIEQIHLTQMNGSVTLIAVGEGSFALNSISESSSYAYTQHFQISGADASNRAVVQFAGIDFTRVNSVEGGESSPGGGMVVSNATLRLVDVTVAGCSTNHSGGAILLQNVSTLEVTDSVFANNTAGGYGGAIFTNSSNVTMTISGTTFSGNKALTGGAIYVSAKANVNITHSEFLNNTASNSGGAVYIYSGILDVGNSLFAGNSAALYGSAIYSSGFATTGPINTRIVNATFVDNVNESENGYAVELMSEKSSAFHYDAANEVFNSIFWGNTGDRDLLLVDSGTLVVAHSLFRTEDSVQQRTSSGTNAYQNTSDCVFGEDPNLNVDYEPTSASSAVIDKILVNSVVDANGMTVAAFDLNGNTRVYGAGLDMGAFEFQENPPPTPQPEPPKPDVFIVTTLEDQFDADPYDNGLSLREAVYLVHQNPELGDIHFAEDIAGGTIEMTRGVINITTDVGIYGDGTIIDAGNQSSIFNIKGTSKNTIDVLLDGLTLTRGYSSKYGGAINVEYADLEVVDVTFSDNHAVAYGGAVYQASGSVRLENATFENNSSKLNGGAYYLKNGQLNVTSTSFENNGSLYGGAYFQLNGTSNFSSSVRFTGNSATWGGAAYLGGGSLNMENVILSGNTATWGGGLYLVDGNATLTDTEFSQNTASPNYGSGIAKTAKSQLTVIKNSQTIIDTALARYIDDALL